MGTVFCGFVGFFCLAFLFPFLFPLIGASCIPLVDLRASLGAILFYEYILLLLIKKIIIMMMIVMLMLI